MQLSNQSYNHMAVASMHLGEPGTTHLHYK